MVKPCKIRRRRTERRISSFKKRLILWRLLAKQEWNCALCQDHINAIEMASIDHIVPLSLGGEHAEHNMQAAHITCNNKKGNTLQ